MGTILGDDATVEVRPGFVRVTHRRAARDAAELDEVIDAMERALRQCDHRRVLFDSRDSDRTPREVQDRLWAWLEQARLERVATLVRSEMLGVAVKMTGLTKGIKLKVFAVPEDAEQWLTSG